MSKTVVLPGQEALIPADAFAAPVIDTVGQPDVTPIPAGNAWEQPGEFVDPDVFAAHVEHLVETVPTNYITACAMAEVVIGKPRPAWMPQEPPRSAADVRAILADMGIEPTNGRPKPVDSVIRRRKLTKATHR
jgi:hypothetical protein